MSFWHIITWSFIGLIILFLLVLLAIIVLSIDLAIRDRNDDIDCDAKNSLKKLRDNLCGVLGALFLLGCVIGPVLLGTFIFQGAPTPRYWQGWWESENTRLVINDYGVFELFQLKDGQEQVTKRLVWRYDENSLSAGIGCFFLHHYSLSFPQLDDQGQWYMQFEGQTVYRLRK